MRSAEACFCLYGIAVTLAGCAPAPPVPSSLPPLASRAAGQLGPTSTASPPRPTLVPLTPTATLVPIPTPSRDDWARGPASAGVTLLVYSDFQCRLCAQLDAAIEAVQSNHPKEVRFVFRLYPLLTFNNKASLAAQAAEAAGAQGEFWALHDLLFQRQDEWLGLTPEAFEAWILQAATDLPLDQDRFEQALADRTYAGKAEGAFGTALASGLPGVPFLFVNGQAFRLTPQLINVEAAVRLELIKPVQFDSYPPMTLRFDREYRARLRLDSGDVVIRLFPDSAPLAVNSFIFLAEQGWYDGNPIQRVLPGMLVESGDPSGTGLGDPGYHFPVEADPALRFDRAGVVALSSSGAGLSSGQYFISLGPLPRLDGARTIFGQVISGLDLLLNLPERDPLIDLLDPPGATVEEVTIEAP